MTYGFLDRYFYKPLFVIGFGFPLVVFAYTKMPELGAAVTFAVIFTYLLVVRINYLHEPITLRFSNIRTIQVENPISDMKNLLLPEFSCRNASKKELIGRKVWGKGGWYWAGFELSETDQGIEAKINCNSPVPEHWITLHSVKSALESAARSVGYQNDA